MLGADAEALDQPVADRERGVERDLLSGDRRDDALERLDGDRRPQPAELLGETRQHGLGRGERVERIEVELGAEQLAHHGLDARVERLDVDASVGPGDPHLLSVDDPVQPVLLPEVREVGPEGAVAGGRELEGVRIWKLEQRHAYPASAWESAWKSVKGSNVLPRSAR